MKFEGLYGLMACDNSYNCSERGNCENGVCICQVQFAGKNCTHKNIGYMAAFSSIFCLMGIVSIIQLIICIYNEYKHMKHPRIVLAFRVTTQKLLHGVVIMASAIRVLYFTLQGNIPDHWLTVIESAYHPFLITGLSLVVCYWSEAFFLETASVNASRRAQFLSKSLIAFSLFNVILYILLIAQFIATGVGFNLHGDLWINGAFQASFAILLFVVYVVFLGIGVEIFFKIRGAFTLASADNQSNSSSCRETVNKTEIFKSRLALVSQALLTLLTVLCVVFDAVGNLWKYKVNSSTRSTHEVIYRIAEVGAVLWFPCVLWTSATPEKLWFLNPRCLLKLTSDAGGRLLSVTSSSKQNIKNYNTFIKSDVQPIKFEEPGHCWICYDPERTDAGDFIKPCLCKGGMAQVHHHCLRKWLLQGERVKEACCKVCQHRYNIEEKPVGFTDILKRSKKSTLIIPAIIIAVVAPCASLMVFLLCNELQTYVKVLVLGITILLELAAFKILGINFKKLYQITRISAFRILNYGPNIKTKKASSKHSDYEKLNGSNFEEENTENATSSILIQH